MRAGQNLSGQSIYLLAYKRNGASGRAPMGGLEFLPLEISIRAGDEGEGRV